MPGVVVGGGTGGGTAPLILTAALPPALQAAADAARSRLYPEGAARAPAHLGLFRHLPGTMADDLGHDIRALAAQMPAPMLELCPAHRKAGALMLPVQSLALDHLRADLAARWHGLLAPGDIAPPALHITLAGARAPARQTTVTGARAPCAPASQTAQIPPALAAAQWRCPGLLLWRVGGYGEACWSPLVAWRFHR